MVAAWSIRMRAALAGVDVLSAIDATAAKAGHEGFDFHEAGNPWVGVRAQGICAAFAVEPVWLRVCAVGACV